MAINTELKLPQPETVHTFPALYKLKHTGDVILFTDDNVGMVVVAGTTNDANKCIGYYSEHWESCYSETFWELLPHGTELLITQGE